MENEASKTGNGNFWVEVDPHKCWNCGVPVAPCPAPAPAVAADAAPNIQPTLAHVLTTVLAVGSAVALQYYGVSIQGVNDLVQIVAGIALWGHAKQMVRASVVAKSQEE